MSKPILDIRAYMEGSPVKIANLPDDGVFSKVYLGHSYGGQITLGSLGRVVSVYDPYSVEVKFFDFDYPIIFPTEFLECLVSPE